MSNKIEEDIKQLQDLKSDRESFVIGDKEHDEIFLKDIQAIENILADRERLIKENEELKEYIFIAPNLDEMTATQYSEIQRDAYLKGRAEEQQKAKQIVNELQTKANKYDVLVQKIEEILNNKYIMVFEGDIDFINNKLITKAVKYIKVDTLQDLLIEGEKI